MPHLAALSGLSDACGAGPCRGLRRGLDDLKACGKDAQKCTKAQDGVRQSLKAEDAPLVQRWRDYAYKQCADRAALTALDREVADGLAAADRRKSEAARLKQESQALLGAFTGWIAGSPRHTRDSQCQPGLRRRRSRAEVEGTLVRRPAHGRHVCAASALLGEGEYGRPFLHRDARIPSPAKLSVRTG